MPITVHGWILSLGFLIPLSTARAQSEPCAQPKPPELIKPLSAGTAKMAKVAYIPPPRPVKTTVLIGAHNCPLWVAEEPRMWEQVLQHPERTPALGFYDQANPQVADWETKWAVEHGISFFV